MYYVPAPGKRSAVLRDWMVMLLCRPFFPKLILHWHAAGLASWLEADAGWLTRVLTRLALRRADLSIVLSDFNRADAESFSPKAIAVVKIGIPDPCPRFEAEILPRREDHVTARRQLLASREVSAPEIVKVLYLAHGMREKGLFDTLEGVLLANEQLGAEGSLLRLDLTVIGAFFSEAVRAEFQGRIERARAGNIVRCLGFVSAETKIGHLKDADLFCFPTYYSAENQPGNLIEAMAFGLPCVTTKWRSIPEMLPAGYPALVDPQSPRQVAQALRGLLTLDLSRALREQFLRHFTLEQHLRDMAAAIHGIEKS
jgi:glycosyltransferase involved in cell wall biosynthesis